MFEIRIKGVRIPVKFFLQITSDTIVDIVLSIFIYKILCLFCKTCEANDKRVCLLYAKKLLTSSLISFMFQFHCVWGVCL